MERIHERIFNLRRMKSTEAGRPQGRPASMSPPSGGSSHFDTDDEMRIP